MSYQVIYTDEIENADTPEEAAQFAFHSMQEADGANFEVIDMKTGKSEMIYHEWNRSE